MIQTSTMLICTISQCEGNFEKMGSAKSVNPITFFYEEFSIHFRKSKSFVVTLFMDPQGSALLPEDISNELVQNFLPLNSVIPVDKWFLAHKVWLKTINTSNYMWKIENIQSSRLSVSFFKTACIHFSNAYIIISDI